MDDMKVVVHQHECFGPFPIPHKDIAVEDTQEAIIGIMSAIPPNKLKPFRNLSERKICNADKEFVPKIMKLDPRDRPPAKELWGVNGSKSMRRELWDGIQSKSYSLPWSVR